jgi:dihydrofolate synthase / folylpolyglutamate synthase
VDFAAALAYLDEHASYEKTGRIDTPSLAGITTLLEALGDPHRSFKVIHVTGTNGKGSTTAIISRLLMAHGLRVGTYSSPHLESVRERIQLDCDAINEHDFAGVVADIARVEPVIGHRPSYFEILTAGAFVHFANEAIDVAVIEVGMLGRWDATNVVSPDVSVITNIALDHTEFAGPSLSDIAREKAGIIKSESTAVVGETRPELVQIFREEPHSRFVSRGEEFDVRENFLAVGGRQLTVTTQRAAYEDVFLPLHGQHQGDNAAIAIAAVEEFFDAPLPFEVLQEAFLSVVVPGRFEIVSHQPLVILDGAHNPAGSDVCASVFMNDFHPEGRRILVVGSLRPRDIGDVLAAFRADEFDVVITCTAPSPRACESRVVAAAAEAMGCDDVVVCETVEDACNRALRDATAEDAVLVTGSLYVVGSARPHLRRVLP